MKRTTVIIILLTFPEIVIIAILYALAIAHSQHLRHIYPGAPLR